MVEAAVHDRADALPAGFSAAACRPMAPPRRVLLCPPDHFQVIDVKNEFMRGNLGAVDASAARAQWDALRAVLAGIGLDVALVPATPGCEDMVFAANQTFPGVDAHGARVCVTSHMRHPSRRREVPAFADWFRADGYAVEDAVPAPLFFEGCGDALWHPGRALIWGGHGERTSREVYPALARRFGVPVLTLELSRPPFYHLDTCLCAIDERTVLVHPQAFTPQGLALVRRVFPRVVEVDADEASRSMACNAAAFAGGHVVIESSAQRTAAALRALGYHLHPVPTSEFMKSGGSVFCLKMSVY